MKKIIIIFLLLASYSTFAQENPTYNKQLADSLGADEYGMKSYFWVILKTGTNNVEDKEKRNTLFRGHMDNITRLAKEGKLIVAGPLGKNDKQYRGIFIFNVKTKEEVEKLLSTDPTIKEKVFDVEIYEWYGSAALPEYLKVHSKIEKTKP